MNQLVVRLQISREQYLRFYQGVAQQVHALSEDGRRVAFPAESLRPFVLHEGIHGRFLIRFDDQGKLIAIERLS